MVARGAVEAWDRSVAYHSGVMFSSDHVLDPTRQALRPPGRGLFLIRLLQVNYVVKQVICGPRPNGLSVLILRPAVNSAAAQKLYWAVVSILAVVCRF